MNSGVSCCTAGADGTADRQVRRPQNPYARLAQAAAWVIFAAFLVHNTNAIYIEPKILGFEDPASDYAKVEKLRHAIGHWPWLASGAGHFLTGLAAVPLALWAGELVRQACPVGSALLRVAGLFAAAGFLLGGITDLLGSHSLGLLAAANPAHAEQLYLADSLLRVVLNGFAIVCFGWFVAQLSWCAGRGALLPRGLCRLGYVAAASALLFAVVYVPLYLPLYLIWCLWLAIALRPRGRQ